MLDYLLVYFGSKAGFSPLIWTQWNSYLIEAHSIQKLGNDMSKKFSATAYQLWEMCFKMYINLCSSIQ